MQSHCRRHALTQDNEEMIDISFVGIDNSEASSDYQESIKDFLEKMVVVSNEEFMKLYFQRKVCLLYENE